uniref:MTM0897 n=1 Tax=Volvox carteri f. nagariensis TaxID=3068 RepID=D9CJ86_VOLCA|nr:MTM0897 [Volvox carteri f. nagariensis]
MPITLQPPILYQSHLPFPLALITNPSHLPFPPAHPTISLSPSPPTCSSHLPLIPTHPIRPSHHSQLPTMPILPDPPTCPSHLLFTTCPGNPPLYPPLPATRCVIQLHTWALMLWGALMSRASALPVIMPHTRAPSSYCLAHLWTILHRRPFTPTPTFSLLCFCLP